MQEVAKLRRSLDDAEGLSRDTKKEWAVLRSQNISLEETMVSPQKSPDNLLEMVKMKNRIRGKKNCSLAVKTCSAHDPLLDSMCPPVHPLQVTLTANHEKMEAEVTSLRSQLETEKSCYKKMQSDLQRELNVAFDENTKLTSLLDGKVPKSRF